MREQRGEREGEARGGRKGRGGVMVGRGDGSAHERVRVHAPRWSLSYPDVVRPDGPLRVHPAHGLHRGQVALAARVLHAAPRPCTAAGSGAPCTARRRRLRLTRPRSRSSRAAAGVAGPTLRSSMSSWRARQVLKATDVEKRIESCFVCAGGRCGRDRRRNRRRPAP